MKWFHTFCTRYNVMSPFPVSEYTLCCFAAYLADEGLAPQTVKSYQSAVRNMQLSLGLPDPRDHFSSFSLRRVLAGIGRARHNHQLPQKVCLPITASLLGQIHSHLVHSSHPDKVLIWAVASAAFFGFCRLGELLVKAPNKYNPRTHLSWGDVAVDSKESPSMVKIHLKTSKCDQFGRGVDIVVGRTNLTICPVAAMMGYITQCQDEAGPFFIRDHKPVTKAWFIHQVRGVLSALRLPQDDYAGHSFRIGAATSAALARIEDSTIQALPV